LGDGAGLARFGSAFEDDKSLTVAKARFQFNSFVFD